MKYRRLIPATFIKRPNRFLAHVRCHDEILVCHVKNTGRLGELLIPGTEVLIEPADNPKRKTAYSLISVKKGTEWVNIDSQVVNEIAAEWIAKEQFLSNVTVIQREKTYGDSRFDLYVEADGEKWYIEVKGVTLEDHGLALFPDAPTERGVKHVEELIRCHKEGYSCAVLFVIAMQGVHGFAPHGERHPAFKEALQKAYEAGVHVMAVSCRVDEEGIVIDDTVPVCLE